MANRLEQLLGEPIPPEGRAQIDYWSIAHGMPDPTPRLSRRSIDNLIGATLGVVALLGLWTLAGIMAWCAGF